MVLTTKKAERFLKKDLVVLKELITFAPRSEMGGLVKKIFKI